MASSIAQVSRHQPLQATSPLSSVQAGRAENTEHFGRDICRLPKERACGSAIPPSRMPWTHEYTAPHEKSEAVFEGQLDLPRRISCRDESRVTRLNIGKRR